MSTVRYTLAAAAVHIGPSPRTGHYRALLFQQEACEGHTVQSDESAGGSREGQIQAFYTDDGVVSQAVDYKTSEFSKMFYLVWLVRQ